MVEYGAAADVGLPPRFVGGGENPAAIDVKVQSGTLGDPLPGLAVVQRRGPACQLHRIREYVGIHQYVWHDQPPVPSPRVCALLVPRRPPTPRWVPLCGCVLGVMVVPAVPARSDCASARAPMVAAWTSGVSMFIAGGPRSSCGSQTGL